MLQFVGAGQLSRKAWLPWEKAGSSLLLREQTSPGHVRHLAPAAAFSNAGA